jgi:hypothetical protein
MMAVCLAYLLGGAITVAAVEVYSRGLGVPWQPGMLLAVVALWPFVLIVSGWVALTWGLNWLLGYR